MNNYTVTWTIDTSADSPEEAARYIRDNYFRSDHHATVFHVENTDVEPVQLTVVDLDEDE